MYVFISHSSKNSDVAERACKKMESEGIQCFLAPRDIQAGHMYADDILDAINSSDALLLLLSKDADASPHVLREVERAVSKKIPVLVYKLEDFQVSKAMEYFLMSHQWMDPAQDQDMSILVNKLKSLENSKKGAAVVGAGITSVSTSGQKSENEGASGSVTETAGINGAPVKKNDNVADKKNKIAVIACIAAAVSCIMMVITIIIMTNSNKNNDANETQDIQVVADNELNTDVTKTKVTEVPETGTSSANGIQDETEVTADPETGNATITSNPGDTAAPAEGDNTGADVPGESDATGTESSAEGEGTEVAGESDATVTSAPVVTETPAKDDVIATSAPVVTETPTKDDATTTLAPVATETPVKDEATATSSPVTTEAPTENDATGGPEVTEAPSNGDSGNNQTGDNGSGSGEENGGSSSESASRFAGLVAGDEVEFGSYLGEPIEWMVLRENEDGTKLLVAKYVLTMKSFDVAEGGKFGEYDGVSYLNDPLRDNPELQLLVRGNSNWDVSNIRTWLNSDSKYVTYNDMPPKESATSEYHNGYERESGFLYGFSEEEKAMLVDTVNVSKGNIFADGDIVTTDKVFLLSIDELGLFADIGCSISAIPTDAAIEQDKSYIYTWYSYGDAKYSQYWLRDATPDYACRGYLVLEESLLGDYHAYDVGVEGFGIRPAITVK